MDKGRISKEFRDMEKHGKDSPVNASLVGDDLTHWKGTLRGPVRVIPPTIQPAPTMVRRRGHLTSVTLLDLPFVGARFQEGTPYEGGTFVVDIVLPDDYPFAPPKVRTRHSPALSWSIAAQFI
jgi:ubiquitin-conjugating enzyme (huntingtin interacting protein 2)|eukprot:COSAG03_NODE_286_length_9393_cov_7.458145_4_plen_123_part_00